MTRRIAVDLLYFTGKRGGTETYVRQVLPRVVDLLGDVQAVGLTNTAGREALAAWFPGELRTLPISGENRPVWAVAETVAVERAAARAGADVLWCPANFGPPGRRVPRVVTVHDVIAFDHPNPEVSRVTQAVTSWLIRRTAHTATHLLTDSDASADAIVRVLGVPHERIPPTPLAGSTPREVEGAAGHVAELGLGGDRPFVLSTGNRMPHKNFRGLLEALDTVPAARRPRLAITGSHGPDPLRADVARLGLGDDVVLLGWVTNDQLESLYQQAAGYACPSLVEGFGLPVLDAMARGCPVLANDLPVLREVGADAARYADATDPHAFGAALDQLVHDPAERTARHAAGLARAASFSWDATARLTADVLATVLERSPRP